LRIPQSFVLLTAIDEGETHIIAVVVGSGDIVIYMVGDTETRATVVGATVTDGVVLTMGTTVVGLSVFDVVGSHVGDLVMNVGMPTEEAINEGEILGTGVVALDDSHIVGRRAGVIDTRVAEAGPMVVNGAVLTMGATVVG